MLAHLQKIITLLMLLLSLTIGGWFASQGRLITGLSAALGFLIGCLALYATVLAIEFLLAWAVNARAGCPPVSWRQMTTAWWHEVLVGPLLFCWRQPFRANAVRDNIAASPPAHRLQGVVFVHGFFCNRAFWSPWMARLLSAGRAYEAVNLEPVFGALDDYPSLINSAVRRVTDATGVPPLLVCHSMGGLAARAWLAAHAADGPSYHVVTIGTPHRGTWLARWGHSTNARQMQLDSDWLVRLNQGHPSATPHRFTCWYSTTDNIVFPSVMATLPGADNRLLQGVAHVQMAFLPQVMRETLAMLNDWGDGQAAVQL